MTTFRATRAFDAVQGLSDLFNISLHEEDIQDFDTRSKPYGERLGRFAQDENTILCISYVRPTQCPKSRNAELFKIVDFGKTTYTI